MEALYGLRRCAWAQDESATIRMSWSVCNRLATHRAPRIHVWPQHGASTRMYRELSSDLARRREDTWVEHASINDVMLVTNLHPEGFLVVPPAPAS